MFKIALTAGHGKYTAGKRCDNVLDPNETPEWVLNDRIADKIETILKDYDGYRLYRTDDTTGETDIPLKNRTAGANNFGADVYISIHHNAGIKRGTGGGIVAFVYTKPSDKSVELQTKLYNALIQATGLKGNRATPLARKNLHECRETKMPAVLLELGFMDSATDVPIILSEDFANKCARAISDVLISEGGLKKKDAAVVVSAKPAESPAQTQESESAPKSAKIKEWQNAAISDGYNADKGYFSKYGADGVWGKECETVAKVAICKKAEVKGAYSNKNLVQFLQEQLGFTGSAVDGKFWTETEQKVIAFQKNNGLEDDGIVGYNTWKKILGA